MFSMCQIEIDESGDILRLEIRRDSSLVGSKANGEVGGLPMYGVHQVFLVDFWVIKVSKMLG